MLFGRFLCPEWLRILFKEAPPFVGPKKCVLFRNLCRIVHWLLDNVHILCKGTRIILQTLLGSSSNGPHAQSD